MPFNVYSPVPPQQPSALDISSGISAPCWYIIERTPAFLLLVYTLCLHYPGCLQYTTLCLHHVLAIVYLSLLVAHWSLFTQCFLTQSLELPWAHWTYQGVCINSVINFFSPTFLLFLTLQRIFWAPKYCFSVSFAPHLAPCFSERTGRVHLLLSSTNQGGILAVSQETMCAKG